MVNDLPTCYGRKCLQESTTARPSLSVEPYICSLWSNFLEKYATGCSLRSGPCDYTVPIPLSDAPICNKNIFRNWVELGSDVK